MDLFTASGVRSLSRISVLFMYMHPAFQPDLTKKDAQKSTARLPDPHPARRSDALF